MTLLELMVVLVIIASVAASALVVTDRMVEQGWIEQTDRNLDAVVAARIEALALRQVVNDLQLAVCPRGFARKS